MTSEPQNFDRTVQPAAGYYPDPAGGPSRRWWDGTAWTDAFEPTEWSTPVGADGRPVQPALPADTKFNTPFIWIFAALPIVSAISLGLYDFGGAMQAQMDDPSNPFAVYTPGYFAVTGLGWLTYAAAVFLAFLDHRNLKRVGVVKPFHWAWTFLSGLVYIIGRTVVLRRRVRAGVGPLWVYIGATVISMIVSISVVAAAFTAAFSAFSTAP